MPSAWKVNDQRTSFYLPVTQMVLILPIITIW